MLFLLKKHFHKLPEVANSTFGFNFIYNQKDQKNCNSLGIVTKKRRTELELSPTFYHRIIRPKWVNQIYIHNRIKNHLNLYDKNVLDFGSGTGANCTLCKPGRYLGIDPDVKRVNFAQKLYPNYDFVVFQNDKIFVVNYSIDVILIVAVRDELTRKAQEGVKVRVLFDAIGSRGMSSTFFEELISNGGEVEVFFHHF